MSMVKKWFAEFHCGYKSTMANEHSGWPNSVATTEKNEKFHYMVLVDLRMKVRVEAVGILDGSVISIFNDHFGVRKLSAKYVTFFHVAYNRNFINPNLDKLLHIFININGT